MEKKNIRVLDKHGRELSPCCEKVAWVLVSRNRAVRINETSIRLILDKHDIRRLKREAIKRDGRVCIYCGRYIPEDETPTVDHLQSKHVFRNGDVGYDSLENLACCCEDCNAHKGMRGFEEYCSYRISVIAALLSIKSKRSMKIIFDYFTNLEV